MPLAYRRKALCLCVFVCSPYGTRTRVSTLKGWHPRPLDEGASKRIGKQYTRSVSAVKIRLDIIFTR